MILSLIINFSILFTFIVLAYFLYEFFGGFKKEYQPYYPILVGCGAGIIAILVMKTSLHLSSEVIGDTRSAVLLLAIIIGGPQAGFITAVIAGLFRMISADFSMNTMIFGLNTIVIGSVMSLIAMKIPITSKNVHAYIWPCVLEFLFFIIIVTPVTWDDPSLWTLTFMSAFAFYATYGVLYIFKKQFAYTRAVEKLADTDYLTGVPNNRIFREELNRLTNNRLAFALILIDIDRFRAVNHHYGHLYGDEILKQLAKILDDYAQEHNSLLTRVSGEEFYLICYDAAPAIALNYASELRMLLRERAFILSNFEEVHVTASFSIVNYPDNAITSESLVRLADDIRQSQSNSKQLNSILHANQLKKEH